MLARRADALTAGDHRYFRFGLIPLIVIGVPITLAVWSHRGIG